MNDADSTDYVNLSAAEIAQCAQYPCDAFLAHGACYCSTGVLGNCTVPDVPAEVIAAWGYDAVRCPCGPAENADGSPRSPWAWHHRDFHNADNQPSVKCSDGGS